MNLYQIRYPLPYPSAPVTMIFLTEIIFVTTLLSGSFSLASSPGCTIRRYSDVPSVLSNCTTIIIDNLVFPAGITFELYLQKGTTVTFKGTTRFEYTPWSGPLIRVKGSNITIQGEPGSVLDGQGPLYWDGKGDKGPKKPQFIKIEANERSVMKNINILNCPHHCIYVGKSDGLTISDWVIDVSDGDKNNFTGHNTDGFDVSGANNLIIENTRVINQDDCIAIRYGTNITVRNMYCSGGHGLSLSVGFNKTSYPENVVSNVLIEDSTVVRSANAIHIKTHTDGWFGLINNITYRNIELIGITNFGINIQQDYANGEGTGTVRDNIPIRNINLSNIHGNMKGRKTRAFYIYCAKDACSDWKWVDMKIENASKSNSCNYSPPDYPC
nr:polygalacturonase-like [Leptinotarsa decemlineata]